MNGALSFCEWGLGGKNSSRDIYFKKCGSLTIEIVCNAPISTPRDMISPVYMQFTLNQKRDG